MLNLYIKYIYKLYKYIHVNTYNYFQNIYCMCVYLNIHYKYTQYKHIYYVNKNFILDGINIYNGKKWFLSSKSAY